MNKKPKYELVKPDPSDDAEAFGLEDQNKRLTWFVQVDATRIGVAWIDLDDSEYIESPSVTIAVDEEYRRRGIGTGVMKDMIKYAYCNLTSETLYSRHRTDDVATEKLNKKVGFENDDKPYMDNDGQQWQNVQLVL